MKQVLHRYRWLVLLFLLLVFVVVAWMMVAHQNEEQRLKQDVFHSFQLEANKQVNMLISEQKNASLALALMLSENPSIKTLLTSECCTFQAGLKQAAEKIERESPVKTIWLQAVNRDGISMERSWVERRGDSLIGVRSDLEQLLRAPNGHPQTTVSTGLFTMSFKTMVPVFENQELLGVVEVISQFQPLIDRLGLSQTQSLVVADRRHMPKLILSRTGEFIDGYYVVNTEPASGLKDRIQQLGIGNLIGQEAYLVKDDWFYTHVPIFNVDGEPEGYWLIEKPVDSFDFGSVDLLLDRYVIIGAVVILMLLLLGLVFVSRQQVFLERNYYRDIIDSASDILYVTNLTRILDANRHFFDLFSDFECLDEFHKHYRCVCDVFEPGEGLLSEHIDGIYWIQYILNHPGETHKAKIIRNNQTYYYAIKIQPLQDDLFGQFTVAMQDITELEKTQHQLAYLSQTDELTGIGNRLFFNKSLSHEIARAQRYKVPLCLAMFDIDHFKSINDTLGHDIGDQVLVELCKVVAKGLRETDIFCRYGGEEFIIMLLETEMGEAQMVTERLLKAVAEHDFKSLPGQCLTCSFGLTCFHDGDTENTLLKRVDQALYSSKNDGRNRVTIYKP
jgi:diguanylate cyclase (GGDEF)-like protein